MTTIQMQSLITPPNCNHYFSWVSIIPSNTENTEHAILRTGLDNDSQLIWNEDTNLMNSSLTQIINKNDVKEIVIISLGTYDDQFGYSNRLALVDIYTRASTTHDYLLTSNSTKIVGLITSYDLLNKLSFVSTLGQTITPVKNNFRLPRHQLEELYNQWRDQYKLRQTFAAVPLFVALLLLLNLMIRKVSIKYNIKTIFAKILIYFYFALSLLINTDKFSLLWNIIYHLVMFCLIIINQEIVPLLLIVVIFLNDNVLSRSVWGINPALGMRFYGVSNQIAAVTIGCTLIGLSKIKDNRYQKIVPSVMLLALTIFFIFKGVNWGAALMSFVGFMTASIYSFKTKLQKFAFVGLCLGAFAFLMLIAPGHIGRINGLGFPTVLATVKGKIMFNIRTLLSEWSLLMVIMVPMIWFEFKKVLKTPYIRMMNYVWASIILTALIAKDLGFILVAILLSLYLANFWLLPEESKIVTKQVQ